VPASRRFRRTQITKKAIVHQLDFGDEDEEGGAEDDDGDDDPLQKR
jgi:hypothetical protein